MTHLAFFNTAEFLLGQSTSKVGSSLSRIFLFLVLKIPVYYEPADVFQ